MKDGGETAWKPGVAARPGGEHGEAEEAAGGGRPDTPGEPTRAAKKRFSDPVVRVFTPATPIPDTFPCAPYFRAAGFGTYHAVFQMTAEELARAEQAVGSEIVGRIAALQARPPGGPADGAAEAGRGG